MQAAMFSKILCLCISLVLIVTNTGGVHSKKSEPKDLRSPININTSRVESVKPAIPLQLYYEDHSIEIVKNSGEEIIVYPLPFTRTGLAKGLLPSNYRYRVHRHFLSVNQNPKGRSGLTINGKGYSVTGTIVFFNLLYGTYENAAKHPDGLVVITEPVRVISKSNPEFYAFEVILRSGKLREPNSTTVTSTKTVYNWYTTFDTNHAYYAYQGSFYNPETKKEISVATHVVTQPPYNYISFEQHKAFRNVLGLNGEPIETITPIYPRKHRTIEASNEVDRVRLPFGGIVFLLEVAYLLIFGTST